MSWEDFGFMGFCLIGALGLALIVSRCVSTGMAACDQACVRVSSYTAAHGDQPERCECAAMPLEAR